MLSRISNTFVSLSHGINLIVLILVELDTLIEDLLIAKVFLTQIVWIQLCSGRLLHLCWLRSCLASLLLFWLLLLLLLCILHHAARHPRGWVANEWHARIVATLRQRCSVLRSLVEWLWLWNRDDSLFKSCVLRSVELYARHKDIWVFVLLTLAVRINFCRPTWCPRLSLLLRHVFRGLFDWCRTSAWKKLWKWCEILMRIFSEHFASLDFGLVVWLLIRLVLQCARCIIHLIRHFSCQMSRSFYLFHSLSSQVFLVSTDLLIVEYSKAWACKKTSNDKMRFSKHFNQFALLL